MRKHKMKMRTYKSSVTGSSYPLFEAPYDMEVVIYRVDAEKGECGDPTKCVIALGVKRIRGVIEAFIGAGRDAYVIFSGNPMYPDGYAYHFVIPVGAQRLRNYFDDNKDAQHTKILLRQPTEGRTLDARSASNARRREEKKKGTGKPVKLRGSPKNKGFSTGDLRDEVGLVSGEPAVIQAAAPHEPRHRGNPSHYRPCARIVRDLVEVPVSAQSTE